MCEIQLTVAGASIIVQKISPSFQVFYFAKLVIMCYAWRNNAIFRRACGSGGMYAHSKLFLRGYSLPYLMRVCPH